MPGQDLVNIWIAASDGEFGIVQQYIQSGGDPNTKDENGYTPIHAAASYGHLELLVYLLQNGGDPNVCDNEGDTPLHFTETPQAAECLIKYGADPSRRNGEGVLPIENADEEERVDLVNYLKAFTPDYRQAEKDMEGADLLHVQEAEDGEAIVSVDLNRLQEMARAGLLDGLIEQAKASDMDMDGL
ncbi:hypothetical protein HDU67_007237 [Dinochytrium kinnereticum]|nr:hypothetical protein HDU67_007237 [Dinochytrium kinnereticum]